MLHVLNDCGGSLKVRISRNSSSLKADSIFWRRFNRYRCTQRALIRKGNVVFFIICTKIVLVVFALEKTHNFCGMTGSFFYMTVWILQDSQQRLQCAATNAFGSAAYTLSKLFVFSIFSTGVLYACNIIASRYFHSFLVIFTLSLMVGTLALALSSMGSNLVSGIFVATIFSTWISDTFYVEYFRLSQKNNKNMAFVLDSLQVQQLVTSMNPLVLARAIHSLLFLLQTDSTYYYLITKICVFRLLFPTLVKLSQNIAPATLLCTFKMFELLHL